MEGYYIKKVGSNKGAPRVWLEGTSTSRAGFLAGQRYDIEVQGKMVVLQANQDGSRIVSGKKIGERDNPIIDINSKALLAMFDGMAAIRVVVKRGEIILMPLASEVKKRERFQRLREKLENGDALTIGSLSHGGGVLSHAIHTGLGQAGIGSKLVFANEIREELLEHAAIHNDAWSVDTQVLAAPMQELAFDDRGVASIPKVEILEMGLPCSGASRAGRSKRGLVHPEAHPEVGHLVVAALVIVSKCNAAIVVLENVPEYAQSASADILRNQLKDMGYNTHERVLNGKEWGSFENRNRWCMVAVTQGIAFDFDQLQPPGPNGRTIKDVLDAVAVDDPAWKSVQYLKDKEVRDAAKGSGFGMQMVSPSDSSVPTIRKGYFKGGSTDPRLQHPVDASLSRLFTGDEHARIKQVPVNLVAGLSNTLAHEVLGQGIVYAPFRDVGHHVGNALCRFAGRAMTGDFTVSVADNGVFAGAIISVDDSLIVQDNGDGHAVIHEVALLDKMPLLGGKVDIVYRGGLGSVSGMCVPKQQGLFDLDHHEASNEDQSFVEAKNVAVCGENELAAFRLRVANEFDKDDIKWLCVGEDADIVCFQGSVMLEERLVLFDFDVTPGSTDSQVEDAAFQSIIQAIKVDNSLVKARDIAFAAGKTGKDITVVAPGEEKLFNGKVIDITDYHVVQNLGRAVAIHEILALDQVPTKNEVVDIAYDGGNHGKVKPRVKERAGVSVGRG